MVEYSSSAIYVQSCTTTEAKIAAIDAVIDALFLASLSAAGNSDLTEYYLDTGQTKVTCKYRGVKEISNAIDAFESIRQRYVSRLNGRQVRHIPEQNLRYGRRCV